MPKNILVIALLIFTAAAAFALPKAKYQPVDSLVRLNIPYRFGPWHGANSGDELAREYAREGGGKVLFIILGAGNFHHPKVCYGASGYKLREISGVKFNLSGRVFKPSALLVEKGGEQFLIIYWLCLDKKISGWAGQKMFELRRAVLGGNRSGLMMRVDVPVTAGDVARSLRLADDFLTRLSSSLPPSVSSFIFGTP